MLSNQPDNGLLLAVDGPSGTGKSTMCRALAKKLDAKYIDTGAMYRVATLAVLDAGVDPEDTSAVIAATADLPMEVSDDPDDKAVILGGRDVSNVIRGAEVTSAVSAVAAIPEVRENLVALQRRLASEAHRAIVEGRDIGTVVLPDAPAKVYMTASAQVRAQRRFDQDTAAGRKVEFEKVLADVERRDALDSSRETSPLKPAADALIVDTSEKAPEPVRAALVDVIERSSKGPQEIPFHRISMKLTSTMRISVRRTSEISTPLRSTPRKRGQPVRKRSASSILTTSKRPYRRWPSLDAQTWASPHW